MVNCLGYRILIDSREYSLNIDSPFKKTGRGGRLQAKRFFLKHTLFGLQDLPLDESSDRAVGSFGPRSFRRGCLFAPVGNLF